MRLFSFPRPVGVLGLISITFLLALPARAGTFKNPPLIPTSTDVFSIATADVNNDGKLDLIYIDGLGYGQRALHVLLGRGDGTFTHAADISLPSSVCCSLTVADVTKDGKLDVMLAGNNAFTVTVAVLVGNGDGTFQPPLLTTFQPSNIGNYPLFRSAFAVGDISGDGKPDLALLDTANEYIYFLLGDGSGRFTPGTPLLTYTRDAVYLQDLNGDGYVDLLTTDSLGAQFEVFLGKGNGTFPSFVRYSLTTSAGPFLPVDVDADGHLDVLTVVYPGQLGYFKGNPDGTFSSLTPLGTVPSSNPLVAATDLNSDGVPDLIFSTASGIAVSLGKSGLSFGSPLTTISGGSTSPYSMLPAKPAAGDFNGDGHTDLAMAVEGGIVLLFGKGDGTFLSDDFYEMNQLVGAAAVADFNGDTFPDIAVTLPATFPRLLLGDGTGKFSLGPDPNSTYGSQAADVTLLAADFNGDGKPDLNLGTMVPNQPSVGNAQSVAINTGKGVFSTPFSVPDSSPILADFNRDGRTDIINASGNQIYVSLGQPDGSFKAVATPLRLPFLTGLFNVGDVNNDGKADLILNYRDHLEVWFGNGDGTFAFSSSINVQTIVNSVIATIADVDGDGSADLILAPDYNPAASVGPLAIFYGNGDGTFQSPVFLPIAHRYSQVTVVDVNRDNKPDLVMTDGAAIAVMINLGGRKFDSEVDYIAGRAVSALNVVDVNSDGFPDIVVANTGGTTVTVLLNQPNGTSPNGNSVSGNLSVTPEPSSVGQPLNIALSVSGQSTGAPVPTGSVSFIVDGVFVADAPLVTGSATYAYTVSLIAAQHTITATYNGDSTYAPKSFSVTHVVRPPTYSTQTTLAASPTTLLASHTVRLSATVTSAVPVPTGAITFLDGSSTLGSATIDSTGAVYFDTALLAPGVHSIAATFQGYTQYNLNFTIPTVAAIFSPSTSPVSSVTVTANVTSISLTSSSNSATAGTVLTFVAQTSSSAGVPFGGVSFYDGNVLLGTRSVQSTGSASFSTASLTSGSHSITGAFNANGPYAGSTSAPLSIGVTSAPAAAIVTIVALESQWNSASGTSSLTATVFAPELPPGGTVSFLDNGSVLGTGLVDAFGVARLANARMELGTHSLTASFGGTAHYAPSVSPFLNEQWPASGPGFSLQLTPAQSSAAAPAVLSLQVYVAQLGNFRQAVQLSCLSGLPHGYACIFSPETLNGSGKSALLIVPTSNVAVLPSQANRWPGITAAFIFILLLGSWRRPSLFLPFFMVVSLVTVLTGCERSTPSFEAPQTIVLTVQASALSGSQTIIHSEQISVQLSVSK
jgi:hypothetical protein